MAATLLISSKNYSSWSLRGFLLCRLARMEFAEQSVSLEDPNTRAELLLRASSIRVPCLVHDGVTVWDTLAIAEYLHEVFPNVGMYPGDRMARARCRSISGEMHSGFSALRSSLPMNLRLHRPGFTVWSAARADIDRITEIWRECCRPGAGLGCSGGSRQWPTRCMRRSRRGFAATTSPWTRSAGATATTSWSGPTCRSGPPQRAGARSDRGTRGRVLGAARGSARRQAPTPSCWPGYAQQAYSEADKHRSPEPPLFRVTALPGHGRALTCPDPTIYPRQGVFRCKASVAGANLRPPRRGTLTW